jgi:parallel beta-helix repeat protein
MRVTVGTLAGLALLVGSGCKDVSEPSPEPTAVDPATAAATSPLQISSLTVSSGKKYSLVQAGVKVGAQYYIDRTWRLNSPLPTFLEGATLIRSAQADRSDSPGSSSFIRFDVNQAVTVYVAHDDRTSDPAWLKSGFEDTGTNLVTSDAGRTYSVYRREFPQGRVTLGSNIASGDGRRMYLIAVAPTSGSSGGGEPSPTPPPSGSRAGYYVSPSGSASGDGSAARPWSLATLLSHPSTLRPGDTVWVRGGTYSTQGKTSQINGSSSAPIIVRAYPGEQVRWDGGITIRGSNTWYWGLELYYSGWNTRRSGSSGSWPSDIPGPLTSVNVFGPRVKFINCIVHDLGEGFDFWTEAVDAELSGNIVFNNGWSGPDRGHGHGIYTQNASGTKRIVGNVIFNNFGNGIQAYGSSSATIRGYYFEGNASFGNGSVGDEGLQMNYIIGGGSPAEAITFTKNYGYHTNLGGGGARVGWGNSNRDISFTGNLIVGETAFYGWQSPQVTGNTFVGRNTMMQLVQPSGSTGGYQWSGNGYYRVENRYQPFSYMSGSTNLALDFSGWKSRLGIDGGSSFTESRPTGSKVVVRASTYERGHGIIIAYDWSRAGSVTADLSSVLSAGQAYEVRNAQDPLGAPVTRGTYGGGSVTLPTSGLAPVQPAGGPPTRAVSTGPEFAVFVVVPR